MSRHDELLKKGKEYNQRKTDKITDKKKQMKKLEDCTFRPKTKNYNISNAQMQERRNSKKIHQHLHNLKKDKGTGRQTDDIEYERQEKECTF